MEYEQPPRVQVWVICDSFMLVGAMNPCPCGYYGDPRRECPCSPGLARTIADLAGSEHVQQPHLAEASQYRPRSQFV